jgi:ribosomal protein S18 acetylase RimI-like enzyme
MNRHMQDKSQTIEPVKPDHIQISEAGFTVREATEKDYPAVLSLIKELAEYERAPDAVTNSVEQMEREQNHFSCFVAELPDGTIAGMALFFTAYFTWVGKSIYLEDIIVSHAYRQMGIGMALMKRVIRRAQDENCKRVRWQVLDWNEPAIGFYRKCGVEISGDWLNCTFDEEGISRFNESAGP